MILRIIISMTAFILIAGSMGLILHLAGYKKRKSCTCGHSHACKSGEPESCQSSDQSNN